MQRTACREPEVSAMSHLVLYNNVNINSMPFPRIEKSCFLLRFEVGSGKRENENNNKRRAPPPQVDEKEGRRARFP